MKIALVSIDPGVIGCTRPTRSLGCYQLRAWARNDPLVARDCQIDVVDWMLPNFGGEGGACAHTHELVGRLLDAHYDLIGFSTRIWNYYHVHGSAF